MANLVPPVPLQSQTADDKGLVTMVWADWFKQVLARLGGNSLPTADTASGYQALPSGLYLQWGISGTLSSNTTNSITFGTSFPSSCLQVLVGIRNNSAAATSETGHWGTGNYSKTGFDLYNKTSASYVFNWLAIGY